MTLLPSLISAGRFAVFQPEFRRGLGNERLDFSGGVPNLDLERRGYARRVDRNNHVVSSFQGDKPSHRVELKRRFVVDQPRSERLHAQISLSVERRAMAGLNR